MPAALGPQNRPTANNRVQPVAAALDRWQPAMHLPSPDRRARAAIQSVSDQTAQRQPCPMTRRDQSAFKRLYACAYTGKPPSQSCACAPCRLRALSHIAGGARWRAVIWSNGPEGKGMIPAPSRALWLAQPHAGNGSTTLREYWLNRAGNIASTTQD